MEYDESALNAITIDLRYFQIDLHVETVFKDLSDHNFWIYQSQIQKTDSNDWDSAIDYVTNGLRSNPLNL